jgi:uncharacterized protein YqhQ
MNILLSSVFNLIMIMKYIWLPTHEHDIVQVFYFKF